MLIRRISLGYLVLALLITLTPTANSKPVKLNQFGLPKSIELTNTPKLVNLGIDLANLIEVKPSRVCSLNGNSIVLLKPGNCRYRNVNKFEKQTNSAARWQNLKVLRPNPIRFELPEQIAISNYSIQIKIVSVSNGRIRFQTTSPSTCEIENDLLILIGLGTCLITARQSEKNFHARGAATHTLQIIEGDRQIADQPDLRSGFQVKFVYVVPKDRLDRKLDQNNVISRWITEGQEFLSKEINRQLPIDITQSGYDIQYLASSFSSSELTQVPVSSDCYGAVGLLATELGIPCLNTGTSHLSRKHYVLLVDLPIFNDNYCGSARIPGSISLVAVGTEKDCSGRKVSGFSDWVVMIWLHEVIHGLGVRHVPKGDCDLMEEFGDFCRSYQIDKSRNKYFGSDRFGADLAKLDIWLRP